MLLTHAGWPALLLLAVASTNTLAGLPEPRRLSPGDAQVYFSPQVAPLRGGSFAVLWGRYGEIETGDDIRLELAFFDRSGELRFPPIDVGPAGEKPDFDIASDGDRRVGVARREQDEILVTVFLDDGQISVPAFQAAAHEELRQVRLAMSPHGRFSLLWQQAATSPVASTAWQRGFEPNGTAVSAPVSVIGPLNQEFAAETQFDDENNTVVVWDDMDTREVLARRVPIDGNGIGPEIPVSDPAHPSLQPALTVREGIAAIVWSENVGTGTHRIRLQRFTSDTLTPVAAAMSLDTFNPCSQGLPDVALDSAKYAQVTWVCEQEGQPITGWIVEQSPDGVVLKPAQPLGVSRLLADWNDRPLPLAASSAGTISIWQETDESESGTIFGQRFVGLSTSIFRNGFD